MRRLRRDPPAFPRRPPRGVPVALGVAFTLAGCGAGVDADGVAPPATFRAGTYHLLAGGERITLELPPLDGPSPLRGRALGSDGTLGEVEVTGFTAATGEVELHRDGAPAAPPATGGGGGDGGAGIAGPATPAGLPGREWMRFRIVDGVLVGRLARVPADAGAPSAPAAFSEHVTGWSSALFDGALAPRVYQLSVGTAATSVRAVRLRLDRAASPAGPAGPTSGAPFVARWKQIATDAAGAVAEELELEADVTTWDGDHLAFAVHPDGPGPLLRCAGRVVGRLVSGTCGDGGPAGDAPFSGVRAEVLGHGFAPLSAAALAAWQAPTRGRLAALIMDGNPAPLSRATVDKATSDPLPPGMLPTERDDDPAHHPQRYRQTELDFSFGVRDADAPGPSLVRKAHGYLAVPTTPAPAGGFPAVLALNGHYGSARQLLDPNSIFHWYGDAFARRGYVVLALDVSHRAPADRAAIYADIVDGDDPGAGNGLHPAVRAPGLDSDWEEDGERAWDALRALEVLRARPEVNPARVGVVGMSMGGEVAAYAAALDPQVAFAVVASFEPDLAVLDRKMDNHPCWRWAHADVREYLDSSDLLALVAPRGLVVETGRGDRSFSLHDPPFAGDKQILRRARAAYASAPARIVHYLHYDVHRFHVGDVNPTHAAERRVRMPVAVGPGPSGAPGWQSDPATVPGAATLFDLLPSLTAP